MLLNGFGEGPGKLEKSLVKTWIWHTYFLRKLFKREYFSVMPIEKIRPHVVHLHFLSSPSAIAWLVISFIVFAIYGQPFRGFAHVFEEQNVFIPALTNLDASSSIVWITGIVWIVATLMYALPNAISLSFVRHSVNSVKSGDLPGANLTLPTTTRMADTTDELVPSHDPLGSTVTPTIPERLSGSLHMGKRENGPAIKFKSSKFLHMVGIMNKAIVKVNLGVYHGE